jgi:acyl-coenzyme A thioesterase PaaI-like protein
MTKMLDHIERVLRGAVAPPPIAQLLGFRLTSIKPGEAVVDFEATETHANPMGTLHGGSSH